MTNISNITSINNMTNNLVIIDWDDTLFPTYWTQNVNITIDSIESNLLDLIELYKNIDIHINNIVCNVLNYAKLVIITNGSKSWIDTCLKVLPNTKRIYDLHIFKVMSARDIFSDNHQVSEWKKLAFNMFVAEIINESYNTYNIISIGDSDYEHSALEDLKNNKMFGNATLILKSIKFTSDPELNQLSTQLKRLDNEIISIVNNINSSIIIF